MYKIYLKKEFYISVPFVSGFIKNILFNWIVIFEFIRVNYILNLMWKYYFKYIVGWEILFNYKDI